MKLTHYNDGKESYQSHEIHIKEDDNFSHFNPDVFSHDITDIIGYGATKEEAIKNFKEKFDYLLCEYRALEELLFNTDVLENNLVEVDCFQKEVKEEEK